MGTAQQQKAVTAEIATTVPVERYRRGASNLKNRSGRQSPPIYRSCMRPAIYAIPLALLYALPGGAAIARAQVQHIALAPAPAQAQAGSAQTSDPASASSDDLQQGLPSPAPRTLLTLSHISGALRRPGALTPRTSISPCVTSQPNSMRRRSLCCARCRQTNTIPHRQIQPNDTTEKNGARRSIFYYEPSQLPAMSQPMGKQSR